jgi:hypothetical protein
MLIWCGVNYMGGTSSVQPTGFTERMEISGDDIAWADVIQPSAGATGSLTGASWSSAFGTATAMLTGLMPPSASGPDLNVAVTPGAAYNTKPMIVIT